MTVGGMGQRPRCLILKGLHRRNRAPPRLPALSPNLPTCVPPHIGSQAGRSAVAPNEALRGLVLFPAGHGGMRMCCSGLTAW